MCAIKITMSPWIIFLLVWAQTARGQVRGGSPVGGATTSAKVSCNPLKDVSPVAYAEASRLFEEGNQQAQGFLFGDAVRSYEQALKYWQDPRVYYNLSRAYVALERPLDAYHSIISAIRCGPDVLADDPDQAKEAFHAALELRDRLSSEELAALVLVSDEPGVVVTLSEISNAEVSPQDSAREELKDPYKQVMMPKSLYIKFEKDGRQSRSQKVTTRRGDTVTVQVTRGGTMPSWIPWTILGTGLVVGAVSSGFYVDAFVEHQRLGEKLQRDCNSAMVTCAGISSKALTNVERRAQLGLGGTLAGGAFILAGVGLFWWSPPFLEIEPTLETDIKITPVVSPDGPGVVGQINF